MRSTTDLRPSKIEANRRKGNRKQGKRGKTKSPTTLRRMAIALGRMTATLRRRKMRDKSSRKIAGLATGIETTIQIPKILESHTSKSSTSLRSRSRSSKISLSSTSSSARLKLRPKIT
jgi:hypothetical protein